MKTICSLLMLATAALSSVSLEAQDLRDHTQYQYDRYDGHWPSGEGILYSYKDGLVIGTFIKGKPEGKCICYKPNGEVYWGDYRKGKQTGNGRIYRDNGIVISGQYRNGKYHGLDTLYRSNGTVFVGKYRKGKLKERVHDIRDEVKLADCPKPDYPLVDLKRKQEEFLKELELLWEERNIHLREKAGMISPKFQSGGIDDFALWVNSQVKYPESVSLGDVSRTVIVEFTVMTDGSLADVHALFGSDSALNEAAVEAVKKSPRWVPAEHKGEKRSVRMTVPVVFNP